MATFKGNAAGDNDITAVISPHDVAKVAVAPPEERLEKEKTLQLGRVTATLDGMRVAEDGKASPEACGYIKEALVARGGAMFMDPGEERRARVQALQSIPEAAVTDGIGPAAVMRLRRLVVETSSDAFWRARTGDPVAEVESLRIRLKPNAFVGACEGETTSGCYGGARAVIMYGC